MEATAKKIDLEVVVNLYKEFTQELTKLQEETTLKRLTEAIRLSKLFIKKLREFIVPNDFETREAEMKFFKELKPKFYSNLFYYSAIFQIEINKPIGSHQTLKEYFQNGLNNISQEFEKNKNFYAYLRSGATHCDEDYFERGQDVVIIENSFIEIDSLFSTGYDLLVANYSALERLSVYLNKKISEATNPISFITPTEAPKITWTDSKTALIEVIYAFKAKGSFNNGKATLKEITEYFQTAFGVEINNPTRDFQEILRRKTGYTIYLDGLKDNYLKYIDAIENKERR